MTRGCGRIYPSYARFCPRCGNASPYSVQGAAVVSAQATSAGRNKSGRPFRMLWLFIAVPCAFNWLHGHHRPAHAQPQAVVSTPVAYQVPSAVEPSVTSLEAFESQAAQPMDVDARNVWREQVGGQRVQWIGYVFTSPDGVPALASTSDRALPSIHLQTASRAAKSELRGIAEGAKVQIDGVLMDDQWLHVIHARRVQ